MITLNFAGSERTRDGRIELIGEVDDLTVLENLRDELLQRPTSIRLGSSTIEQADPPPAGGGDDE